MSALSKDDPTPLHDEEKSDIYALGMTVLWAATLNNV